MKKLYQLGLLIFGFLTLQSSAQASFNDVPESHPYFKAISYLEGKGVLEGYENGMYLPEKIINRVETLKIALLGSGVEVPEIGDQFIFPDVLFSSWYGRYVSKAKELGIVSGDADTGMFRPGDPVQLDEILKILLEAKNVELPTVTDNPFWDVPASSWSAPYFKYAKSLGMFSQVQGENVEPAKLVTRGLMADLIYQLETKPEGYQEGVASYYGLAVHGSGTASGEKFDAYAFTAAHPTLPFGTMVLVRNLENDKTVTVKINDRGPYSEGRIIDLSQAAFESISPLSRGVIRVSIVPLDQVHQAAANCAEVQNLNYILKNSFENITLNNDVPNRFTENEVLHLSGTSQSASPMVTGFIVNESGQQSAFYSQKDANGNFSMQVFFPSAGSYKLGILAGESGSGAAYNIQVLSKDCLVQKLDETLPILSDLKFLLNQGNVELKWLDQQNYKLTKINFRQKEKSREYIVYNEDKLTPNYADFKGWEEGLVIVEVSGAKLESNSILTEGQLIWSPSISTQFKATTHHDYHIEKSAVKTLILPETLKINSPLTLEFDPLVNIRKEGLLIVPDGQVESKILISPTHDPVVNQQGISIFPSAADHLKISFTPAKNLTHFIEINNEEGLAAINIPVYPEGLYPLLPNPLDFRSTEVEKLSTDLTVLQNQMLSLVNKDRNTYGAASVKLDPKLNELAQARSDDMVKRQYLSHWNPEGLTSNDLRKNYAITQFVSENIARDSGLTLAEYGLMRSALHRVNILDTEWKRAGFGITKDPQGGGYIVVQIFSDDPINLTDLNTLRNRVLSALNLQRTVAITPETNLNSIAQTWSERMVTEDYFNFTAPNGDTLVDKMRDAGIQGTVGTYIVGNSSFDSALEKISQNDQLKESRWEKIGIGIKQDKFGIIKFTLSYTE